MKKEENSAGLAALSVCEALIIVLVEQGALDWNEICEALDSAVEAHNTAEPGAISREDHLRAAERIESLLRRLNTLHPGSGM